MMGFIIFLGVLVFLYKIGIKKIMTELSKMDVNNKQKIEELQDKIKGQLRGNHNSNYKIETETILRRTSAYTVYDGSFLNQ